MTTNSILSQPRSRLVHVASVLGLVLALAVALLPGAAAGGPTSVLLTNHQDGTAAAALAGSSAYADLTRSLNVEGSLTGSVDPPEGLVEGSAAVSIMWFIHDRQLWRSDWVNLVGDELWVASTLMLDGPGSDREPPQTWHRPADEPLLRRTLSDLGVLPGAGAAARPAGGEASMPALPTVAATDAAASDARTTDWWPVPVAMLFGLVIGGVVTRARTGRVVGAA